MPGPYNAKTTSEEVVEDLASYIRGKVVLVTGVFPGGLGAVFVEQIAVANPELIILAGRSPEKIKGTTETILGKSSKANIKLLSLDLGSLQGAEEAAATINGWSDVPHVDVLVNNAGSLTHVYEKTQDGRYEKNFLVNHFAPWLFSNLIMNKILASKDPRIVNVASDGHRHEQIRFHDLTFGDGSTHSKWKAYGQSRTANMLMAVSLAEKLGSKGLTATSLHPGAIDT